jgi:hypothetical protein
MISISHSPRATPRKDIGRTSDVSTLTTSVELGNQSSDMSDAAYHVSALDFSRLEDSNAEVIRKTIPDR